MASSYIYQLSSERPMPKEENEWIVEDDFFEGTFIGEVADSVSNVEDDEERTDAFKDLNDCPGLKYDPETETLTITDKNAYFEPAFRAFKKALDEASEMTFEQFSTRKSWAAMHHIKTSYNDRLGAYVYDNDRYGGLYTLDHWIRDHETGDSFYCGGVVSYHA